MGPFLKALRAIADRLAVRGYGEGNAATVFRAFRSAYKAKQRKTPAIYGNALA